MLMIRWANICLLRSCQMIINVSVCDYCERKHKVVVAIVSRGGDKGKLLCADCVEHFIDLLSIEYLTELEDNGDWRLADYKVKLIKQQVAIKKKRK